MPKRPIIGITTDYNRKKQGYHSYYTYAAAVEQAGGLPMLLPHRVDPSLAAEYLDAVDAVVFSGGDDLNPSGYGEPAHAKSEPIEPSREQFERALLKRVESRRVPTLGICLGSQLMNLHRGGSLHQFIPDLRLTPSLEHRKNGDERRSHPVTIDTASILHGVVRQTEIIANTSHKQAVHRLGANLRIVAKAPDGIVEAIEDPSLPFFVGVQWHPERMTDRPEHALLFEALVRVARQG
jgi:putative glutamine amidotransferase